MGQSASRARYVSVVLIIILLEFIGNDLFLEFFQVST